MAFNRVVVPSEGGESGKLFAEFLRIDADTELSLTEMQSYLYDRLFRLGMVRHMDGTRALRQRRRNRETTKQRRAGDEKRAMDARRARAAKARARAAKAAAGKAKARPRAAKARAKARAR